MAATESRSDLGNASQALMQMLTGFWVSQSIYAAARAGVADALQEGPLSVGELAARLDAHEENLYRLLRALASLGIFRETGARVFELTPVAALLASDHPHSMRPMALMLGEVNYPAWGNAYRAIQDGVSPFEATFGMNAYEYFASHPAEAAHFHAAMTALVANDHRAILNAYDFSGLGTVVDVGGGQGLLLASILRQHAGLCGVLFDLPPVVAQAPALLESQGVASRCRIEAGDFYQAVPGGGDAYILSRVLHGFSDDLCEKILACVHAAMPATARLLVMEFVLEPGNDPATARTKLMDVNMMVFAPGGRDRTREEYRALLERAGLQLTRVVPTESGIAVIEAAKRE